MIKPFSQDLASRIDDAVKDVVVDPNEELGDVGLGEHLEIDESDWSRVDAMTDADIEEAIANDPDTLTVDDWTDAEVIEKGQKAKT